MTQQLWQDYLFLTREMAKFLNRQDFELFEELLSQRENLQAKLDETPDDGFKTSAEGRKILQEINFNNKLLTRRLEILRNGANQQQNITRAYEAFSASPYIGSRTDRQG